MRFALTFAAAFAMAAPAAQADSVAISPAPDTVAVTVYRDDLALITETRTVDLPAGEVKLEFQGVLDTVVAPSAIVAGLEGREKERNFDFNRLTPSALLRAAIGERVSVTRSHAKSGKAKEEEAVIASAGNGVVLRYADRAEAVGCSLLAEKITFYRVPPTLRAKPTLSTTVDMKEAGRRTLTLSYLATGISWQADYVLQVDPQKGEGNLLGWLTINNASQQGFEDAKLGVVAGDLNRVWTDNQRRNFSNWVSRTCWPMGQTRGVPGWRRSVDDRMMMMRAGIPPPPPPPPPPPAPAMAAMSEAIVVTGAQREELGDYQLYAVPWKTSVSAQQTKQVAFVSKPTARFERIHRIELHDAVGNPDEVLQSQIVLRTKNEEAKGLGEPLPKGTVRVISASGRGPLYVGEDQLADLAVGLKWDVDIGASSAVTAQTRVLAEREVARSGYVEQRTDLEVVVRNASPTAANLEVAQKPVGDSTKVSRANLKWALKDGEPTFNFALPPGESKTLTYRVTVRSQN